MCLKIVFKCVLLQHAYARWKSIKKYFSQIVLTEMT